MKQTAEAIIDENGHVCLLESIHIHGVHRALVTILDEPLESIETSLLAEKSLAEDWLKPEEDQAWSHLPPSIEQRTSFNSVGANS